MKIVIKNCTEEIRKKKKEKNAGKEEESGTDRRVHYGNLYRTKRQGKIMERGEGRRKGQV